MNKKIITVMSVVFSQMFKVRVEGVNYLVYLMTGIIMFNYFNEASTNAMTSVVDNFALINIHYSSALLRSFRNTKGPQL